MCFTLKIEAYTFVVYKLNKLKNILDNEEKAKVDNTIDKIKILIENHIQDPNHILNELTELSDEISSRKQINQIIDIIILEKNFKPDLLFSYDNILGRRFESELPILLATNPTKKIMESVDRISKEIIKVFDRWNENELSEKLGYFSKNHNIIAFGASNIPYTSKELLDVLKGNDSGKFIEIMHIHYKFARYILRKQPIFDAPTRKPIGELKNILQKMFGEKKNVEWFFSDAVKKNSLSGTWFRSFIPDKVFLHNPLYTAFLHKGRLGQIKKKLTNQMGLLLDNQHRHAEGFPKHSSPWVADAKSQEADLSSPYVLDLVKNDAVYVSGPSGMVSLLLGQMEILGNFEDEVLKKHYLSAVVAYIVAGGFHSLHEVLGPAEYVLKLIPGYKIQPPQNKILAPPPNFHQFFQQQIEIDPEFKQRYELFWENYLQYFERIYLSTELKIPELKKEDSDNSIKNTPKSFENQNIKKYSYPPYRSFYGFNFNNQEEGNINILFKFLTN